MTTNSTFNPELLDQLLANYEKPEDMTGDDGIFKQLKKALIERALGAGAGLNSAAYDPGCLKTPAWARLERHRIRCAAHSLNSHDGRRGRRQGGPGRCYGAAAMGLSPYVILRDTDASSADGADLIGSCHGS